MHNLGKNTLGSVINPVIGSVLALSLITSTAPAQSDRLVDEPGSRLAAQRTVKTSDCDFPTLTVVRTQNAPVSFTNTAFLTLPGSAITFETFGSRCVKVHFTARAAATAHCFVRALVNGIVMDPNGANFQTLVSNDNSFNAHAYEWVSRVDDGNHIIVIQGRVNSGTCTIDDWTVDLEVWDD
jgi:hypothetical protein